MTIRRFLPIANVAAVGVLAVLALSCGGGSPSSPNPGVSPTPTPTATPGPGGGGVGALSCPLGKGSPNYDCDRKSSTLLNSVEAAMDLLIHQKPQIFDLNDEATQGSRAYKVLDVDAYFNGVVANLVAAGVCAERDVDDAYQQTIFVKDSNDFSEEFDLLLGTGYMRRGVGAYRTTCTPAAFPLDRAADAPPIGSGCGRPYPAPIARFSCKLHLKGAEYYTLDSTPLVGPDVTYCASIGFTDGRSMCSVRPEGAPDREACENWRVGKALDTGRPGPTWRQEDGTFCTGEPSGCANSPATQYQIHTYRGGKYTVSAENGASCTVSVDR